MDVFYEYLIRKKRTGKDAIISALWIVLASVITILSVFVLTLYLRGFELLLIVGVWYGAIYLYKKSYIEYEYIMTNSVLDIDRIIAKSKRKRIISIDFKNIDICEPKKGQGIVNPGGGVKVLDLSGDIDGDKVYYVDFSKAQERFRVYFQPDSKILDNIRKVNPRFVTVKDGDVE